MGTQGASTLGSVLRALREGAGLSQEELAEDERATLLAAVPARAAAGARRPAATEARTHLGSDRFDDALDTGRGLSAREAAAMVREPGDG